jgi:DNA polymerase III delta subunit
VPKHATIVLAVSSLDMRRKVAKLLLKEAQVVNCGMLEDAADAERWVKARAARDDVRLEPDAVRALVARTGVNLTRLRSGLERVALYAMGQPSVTADDVKQAVMAGPEAAEEFGIANAIGRRDAREALRELGLALDGGAVPYFVLGQIRFAAEKLPPPRVPAGMDAVFRTDLALKTSAGDPRVLLERLVVELCTPPGR